VAACREILDRAYGKAMQPIQGTMDYGISEQLAELFRATRAIRWVQRLHVVRCRLPTSSSRTDGPWPAQEDHRLLARQSRRCRPAFGPFRQTNQEVWQKDNQTYVMGSLLHLAI
jgi:hypothetical protein